VWHNSIRAAASLGTTGPNGTVVVPEPPADDTPLLYEVTAKGYLTRQTDVPAARTPAGVALEVYAEPRPVVELVLPTGYKGVVRGTYRVQADAPFALHQRQFTFAVPAAGVLDIVVPPIFSRGIMPDIRARYADGTPLARTAKDYDVGCRWLEADPDTGYLFVIGTQYEADQVRRDMKAKRGDRQTIGIPGVIDYGPR
jgi:hypothetical protein